jgi:hypothetical protein
MTRKKTSPVWVKDKNEIQKILNKCSSFVEVLETLGLNAHSGNHRTLKQRIKFDNLNIDELIKKRKEKSRQRSIKKAVPISEVMIKNSNYGTNHLKNRLVKEKILKYACEKCGNEGIWMKQKLALQLDHKNGNPRDHRLENICFLCPNCHSQTDTYAGKRNKKNKFCFECKIPTKGKGKKCRKCSAQKQPQKLFVTKEELEKLVKEFPMTELGRKFGTSDNSIRKRCKKLGIEIPKYEKGYWSKLRAGSR